MIHGAHVIVFSKNPEADRAFFRDVLQYPFADAGHGWLIFALPPAELGVHPAEQNSHQLYLMCEDVHATVEKLKSRGVKIPQPIADQGWGLVAQIELPDGSHMGLYQPRHPVPPRS